MSIFGTYIIPFVNLSSNIHCAKKLHITVKYSSTFLPTFAYIYDVLHFLPLALLSLLFFLFCT